jgi:Fe-Mn family superoxide dismutase
MTDCAVRSYPGLRGLKGIPDALVEHHLRLYAGYVRSLNLLRTRLESAAPGTPEFAELHRRTGFEINGARLHELYFGNLSPGGGGLAGSVRERLAAGWGSADRWRAEFAAMGAMRGVGWVVLYEDPEDGRLSNHWIGLHEDGHPAGFRPILVMDVWEHAFTGMERPAYVEAFLANVDGEAVERRLLSGTAATRR